MKTVAMELKRKQKILVVEDVDIIRNDFNEILVDAGYQVDTAEDGREALAKIKKNMYDLIILDRKLNEDNPYGTYNNGVEFADFLREEGYIMPILAVSAYIPTDDDIAKMRKAGIDDFLRKKDLNPTNIRVKLPKKVESTIHKWETARIGADSPKLSVGEFTLDLKSRILDVRGVQIKCTKTERDILEVLLRNPLTILTREQIYDEVWKLPVRKDKYQKTIATHISNLNTKYRHATSDNDKFVEMNGEGYVLQRQVLGLTE